MFGKSYVLLVKKSFTRSHFNKKKKKLGPFLFPKLCSDDSTPQYIQTSLNSVTSHLTSCYSLYAFDHRPNFYFIIIIIYLSIRLASLSNLENDGLFGHYPCLFFICSSLLFSSLQFNFFLFLCTIYIILNNWNSTLFKVCN